MTTEIRSGHVDNLVRYKVFTTVVMKEEDAKGQFITTYDIIHCHKMNKLLLQTVCNNSTQLSSNTTSLMAACILDASL